VGFVVAILSVLATSFMQRSLITTLAPDHVSLSTRYLGESAEVITLRQFKTWVSSVGGVSILQQIDDKKFGNYSARLKNKA
jgi:hypothetical protein